MRKFSLLGFAAIALMTVAFIDSDAQPPGKKGGFGKGGGGGPVTADQIVEHIMSYDKKNTGKVTIDDLPERMQHLVAMGDINKDGSLDREEARKLAETLASFVNLAGGGLPGNGGKGGGGPKGDGGFKGGKGGPKGPEIVKSALDDLELRGQTRDKADTLVRAYQDKLKKYDELSRAELVIQMKDVLNEADYRSFKTTVERPPGGGPKGFKGGKGPPQDDLNARIDQIQKELEDLRKKVQK